MFDAERIDQTIHQYFRWTYYFELANADDSPYDLTDKTAKMQIRAAYNSTEVLCELTTENGGIAFNTVTGGVSLVIPEEIAVFMTPNRKAVYDFKLIDSNDEGQKILYGDVFLIPGVTHQ